MYKVEIANAGILPLYQKIQVKFEFGRCPIIFNNYPFEI
jgi:hypothetical protein